MISPRLEERGQGAPIGPKAVSPESQRPKPRLAMVEDHAPREVVDHRFRVDGRGLAGVAGDPGSDPYLTV